MDALLRRRSMIAASGGSPTPPGPVVSVPYIRGGANGSYIDTGITADNTVKVIVWARNFNPAAGFLFGSRVAGAQNTYAIGSFASQNTGRIRVDFAQTNTTYADDQFSNLSHYHKYELYQGVLKVDDTIQASATYGTFSNSLNIHLLGVNINGTHTDSLLPIDICACQIYKDGVLARDFTAVNSPSVGLYDAVSDTVFTNAGSGSFSYGAFSQNAYTPLEYISDNADAHFDSGAKASYAEQIVSKFRFTTNTANVTLLGYRGNSDWCEFDINYGSTVKMYYRLASASAWGPLYNATQSNFVDQDIVLAKGTTNSASIYKNNAQIGSTVSPSSSSSYISSGNLFVGALNFKGTPMQLFTGRLYYIGIGSSRSLVPAKKNNVAGMYDTYNDVFYPSATSTPFIAGPEL